ncbi:MAG: PD40 domain-containing protein [Candidatus Sumerlaeia bacterium]|nr:PD40 domain-containing protein [Candidatus Sumerlaeia bacterium]
MPFTASRSLLLLLALFLFSSTGFAQQNNNRPAQSIGEITPVFQYNKTTIAVTPFLVQGASVEIETLPRIIRANLELSGLFRMPEDQRAANRQNIADNANSSIAWDRWSEMGVEHYMMGRVVEPTPGNLEVTILLYDVKSRQRVMSRKFTAPRTRTRHLAHQVSDETMLQIHGIGPIFQSKILYASELVPGTREIAVMDADGYDNRQITKFGKLAISPSWGANGTEFYFTSYHGNRANIYGMQLIPDFSTMRYTTGQFWPIAAYGGTNHSPKWNPNARRIAMILSKDGNSEVYTTDRTGQNLTRLTRTRATEGSPEWSPDGRRIAFTSNEEGGVHIYVMNADGSNKRRLTRHGSWSDAVSWSPDGTRLAFVLREGGRNDIYICDVNASRESYRRLTMNQGDNESPTWAPNGRHLAFSSNRSGQWHIYMMLDDGSNQRQLTRTGRNMTPAWGPIPEIR